MNREESTGKVNKGFFSRIRWLLVLYDFLILAADIVMMLVIYGGNLKLDWIQISVHFGLIFVLTFVSRLIWLVYMQVWRFGGIQSYMRLIVADACAFIPYYLLVRFVPAIATLSFALCVALVTIYLLGCLTIRMAYRYAYKCVDRNTKFGHFVVAVIRIFAHVKLHQLEDHENQKIRVAIVGAGRVGTSLAQDLLNSPVAVYKPVCFVDSSEAKVGRVIYNLPVYMEDESVLAYLRRLDVQEIIFTLPQMEQEQKQGLYRKYTDAGYKVKVYDFPTVQATEEGGKRQLREFEPEELLFRRPQIMTDDATRAYYKDKTVLITGGGGSIGSELCRQIASMEPKRIVILDVYENGAYDIQQKLRIRYGRDFPIYVEICSICNREALERVMAEHRPDYVIMAAAHKHVPLMEHNCIEAVENNVFGTLNTVQLAEKYGVKRVMMVSTDKAVNPTNVMGATKRLCEMICQSYSTVDSVTKYSATRFGNVLGSAGSVIPLFKKQIAAGGPVTLTDRRIIRYFMTIPEASQLVLHSGAIAKNGELMVLDMGSPVKILDLAEGMIRLAGFVPDVDIKIVETGLRPGEKLYEELLVRDESLDKTDNAMIFIERDRPIPMEELNEKLDILRRALETGSDEAVRKAMHEVVPTYVTPEEVNGRVEEKTGA